MRQEKKRKAYNSEIKSTVKKSTRTARDEIATGSVKGNEALVAAVAQLDRAVKKGVLHKKTAARRKSRLTLAYNSVAAKPYGTEAPGKPGAKKATKKAAKPVAKQVAAKPTAKKAPAKKAAPKKPAAKK